MRLFSAALIAANMSINTSAWAGTGYATRADWTAAVDATELYARYGAQFPIGFDGSMHFFGGHLIAAPQPAPGGGVRPPPLWTGQSQVWLDLESPYTGGMLSFHRTQSGPGIMNTNPSGGETTAVYYFPPETYGFSVLFLNSIFDCGALSLELESGAQAGFQTQPGDYLTPWAYLSDPQDPIVEMRVENCGATAVGIAAISWAQGPNIGFAFP